MEVEEQLSVLGARPGSATPLFTAHTHTHPSAFSTSPCLGVPRDLIQLKVPTSQMWGNQGPERGGRACPHPVPAPTSLASRPVLTVVYPQTSSLTFLS